MLRGDSGEMQQLLPTTRPNTDQPPNVLRMATGGLCGTRLMDPTAHIPAPSKSCL